MDLKDKVELVIPTHCSNKGNINRSSGPPSIGWIQTTLESLYEQCPETKSLTNTIVVNSKPGHDADSYERNLRSFCNEFGAKLRLDNSPGYRGVRLGMQKWVTTPYLFLVEHDWLWTAPINLTKLIDTLEKNTHINHVRFNKRPNEIIMRPTVTGRQGSDKYLIRDTTAKIPLLHTPCFSNNPHIQRMSKYPEWCDIVERRLVHVGGNGGAAGFEQPLMEQSLDDLEQYGIEGRNRMWGTVLYGDLHAPQTIKHIGI